MPRRHRSSSRTRGHRPKPVASRPPPAHRAEAPARRPDAPPAARFINREIAWLGFNERVLEEALDPTVPLLERVRFLAIFSSNLDEFFMVRLAGVKRQLDAGVEAGGPDGLSPRQVLEACSARLHESVALQHRAFGRDIAPKLAREGVRLLAPEALDHDQRAALADYFRRTILPVVTPLAIDPGHPFPHLSSRTICLAVELRKRCADAFPASQLAIVHIPSTVLPRFIRVPSPPGTYTFVTLEEAIRVHAQELFAGYEVVSSNALRVTRDADVVIDDENAGDLLKTIEEGLRARRMGAAVRLQYDERMPRWIIDLLTRDLEVSRLDLFPIKGMIAFSDLLQLYDAVDLPHLKYPPHVPQRVPALEVAPTILECVRRRDVLVHHPYQSFDYVVRFLREAAEDPHVLAIKMTLYRMGAASPIVEALELAAQKGKQVAVLMELKARFDEEANIRFARRLENVGAHVIYGLPGLKTHAKACLVVRQEGDAVRRYCHLSTGNYNARTAWVYTDIGMFSCREDLCEEVSALFNLITGYCRPPEFRYLALAPTGLRERIVRLIRREREHARAGRPARIVAKMNGLEDPEVIDELYAASRDGVEIDLIVRGLCCLRPGVRGLSERIRVTRIVDRFLEHARVLFVENGGDPEYFLSSADWMPRNLDRRIETMFPVLDEDLRAEIRQVLEAQLEDSAKARSLGPDGESEPKQSLVFVRSQEKLAELATRAARGEPRP